MAVANAGRGAGIRLLALLALSAQAGCSTGGNSPFASAPPIEREFMAAAVTWDLNKDGDVTCDEWKQYVTGLFRAADANRDGVLTSEEFAVLSRSDRLFETAGLAYFDANADGRLTLSEMTEKRNPAFAALDKNGDCVLTRDERVQTSGPRDEAPSSKAMPPSMPGKR